MNIVNVGYDSTNYYVLADSSPKLLIDVGWPGTMPKLQYQCKRTGIDLSALKYFFVTHYHPDHAGLAQELKRAGVKLVVVDLQLAFIPALKATMKPENHYIEIDLTANTIINLADSRAFLAGLDIPGEMISTPGHSEDSVTVILDEGAAFTGDLPHPVLNTEDTPPAVHDSWEKIRTFNVKTIYPGHGPAWPLDRYMP